MAQCRHGLERSWCTLCQTRDDMRRGYRNEPSYIATIAEFPGECEACGQPIIPGMTIALIDGDWIHEGCAEYEE